MSQWKHRNKEYQRKLVDDVFLVNEIGDKIDSCFTFGYVDYMKTAGALDLRAHGLR